MNKLLSFLSFFFSLIGEGREREERRGRGEERRDRRSLALHASCTHSCVFTGIFRAYSPSHFSLTFLVYFILRSFKAGGRVRMARAAVRSSAMRRCFFLNVCCVRFFHFSALFNPSRVTFQLIPCCLYLFEVLYFIISLL